MSNGNLLPSASASAACRQRAPTEAQNQITSVLIILMPSKISSPFVNRFSRSWPIPRSDIPFENLQETRRIRRRETELHLVGRHEGSFVSFGQSGEDARSRRDTRYAPMWYSRDRDLVRRESSGTCVLPYGRWFACSASANVCLFKTYGRSDLLRPCSCKA